jgi:elongation factor 2
MSAPTLLEPVFLVNITCPSNITGSIYNVLSQRRGQVFDEGAGMAGGVANMKAHLPVAESFGFSKSLAEATGGAAFSQLQFDHWAQMDASPMDFRDPESKVGKVIQVKTSYPLCLSLFRDFPFLSGYPSSQRPFCRSPSFGSLSR